MGDFFWDQIFHKSPVLCASGDRGNGVEIFRSIKIFHNCPVLCASGDHAAGEVANAALEAITRRTTPRRKTGQLWKILSTEKIFHAVPRGHPMRTELTIVENLVPKISHFELSYRSFSKFPF